MTASIGYAGTPRGRVASALARGKALVLAHPKPFEPRARMNGGEPFEIEAGTSVAAMLDAIGILPLTPGYAGLLVRRNGKDVRPAEYETTRLAAGDRVIVRVMPREPASIIAFLIAAGNAIASAGSAIAGTVGAAGLAGAAGNLAAAGVAGLVGGAGGLSAFIGGVVTFATGLAAVAGASYVLSLATRALIGSPSGGGGNVSSKSVSPTASGAGNQILPGHPVYVTAGDVRVFPPHVAVPFQPGIVGGDDQDPSLRMLLAVGGNCLVSEPRFGKTDLTLMDAEFTAFQNQTTLDFPTVALKRPGVTLRDEWFPDFSYAGSPATWEIVSEDDESDSVLLIFQFPRGLQANDKRGTIDKWQVSFDIEYREAGAGSWTGFFATDASGNAASYKAPLVSSLQRDGDQRLHLFGQTGEPFFLYLERKNERARHEYRFRLRQHERFLHADGSEGGHINRPRWPKDRWPDPEDTHDSNVAVLSSDPMLVQFAAFRNEPAVENFTPGLSGLDLVLHDQTTKSDESSRVSFRSRWQIPELSGGARTAPTTTSNPVAIVLELMTGDFPGTVAVPDSKIDFDSFQEAFDYCNTLVPAPGGGTEALHRMDAVIDRQIGAETLWNDILSNFRMRLIKLNGTYTIAIDRKRTGAPRATFGETEILEMESDRSWLVPVDAIATTFFNAEKDGDSDEMVVYAASPPVPGLLPNGGYAERTATKVNVSVTVVRSGPLSEFAEITLASGDWAAFPEEGWVCIRWPGGVPYADARLFLLDGISPNLLTLTVIDKAGTLTAGTRNGTFDTTKAVRIDTLELPYSQRPSEVWRETYYRIAQATNRPEVHTVGLGWEGLSAEEGALIEVSSKVPVWGRGSGRILWHDGLLSAVTNIQFDETFDLTGLSSPVVKLVTFDGSQILSTRIDVDASATATLRTLKGSNRWLAFDAPQNLAALGAVIGGGKGSAGHFGELGEETRELIVQRLAIEVTEDLAIYTRLTCLDHAPELFDAVLDQAPVPRFQSGITETGIGERARPAVPALSLAPLGPSTPMGTINAAAPSGGNQAFTRPAGGYLAQGWETHHKASFEGYATAANNRVRAALSAAPTDTVLSVVGASGSLESGTGDERVRGVVGTVVQALSVRRAATGVTKLDVTQLGGGVVELDAPAGQSRFAGFEGAGFVELSGMPNPENNGWKAVTGWSADQLTLSSTTMVTATGLGSERCHQSQFRRTSGSFVSDGLTVGMRVTPAGFESAPEGAAFTVRAVSAGLVVAIDDPFAALATEAGSGDETLSAVDVPLAYEVETNPTAGNDLRLYVTVPLRPGSKSVVSIEEIEARYRLRDRTTGVASGGWVPIEPVAGGALSFTFGPIPADSDFDASWRAISKAGTSSDWGWVTGNGRRSQPAAPSALQVHGDAVAVAEGSEFALRVEWDAPADGSIGNYLVRHKHLGADHFTALLVYDKSEALIVPAKIGDYDLEVYRLAESGEPSAALRATFSFEPDRDFELTSVSNLRLVNHAATGSGPGIDPRFEFTGQDVLLSCVEPAYSSDSSDEETSDTASAIDPLVKAFEWQVFDPATGTVLRTDSLYSRDYRYTRAMNADDQALAFGRGPQRDLGFRTTLVSTTNRRSQTDQIVVANPRPTVPDGITLTSTPGNSTNGLDAIVHVAIDAGTSKSDSDFAQFGVWASTTPGFTPGPSTFRGLAAGSSNLFSFPAASGTTVYVRAGGLDGFHGQPELIAAPASELNLLAEQSIETRDGAVFPVDTEDIIKKAVTDVHSAKGSLEILGGSGDTNFRQLLSLNGLPEGGIAAISASATVVRGSNQIEGTVRMVRDSRFSAVKLWDNSAGVFLDFTDDAYDSGAGDVTLFGDTSDWLYLGSTFPIGSTLAIPSLFASHIGVVVTVGAGSGTLVREYSNGSGFSAIPGQFDDTTSGFNTDGTIVWTKPLDAAVTTVDGVSLFWTRFQRASAPSGGATAARIYLREVIDQVEIPPAGPQEFLTTMFAATLDPTETLEGVFLEANSTAGGSNPQQIQSSTMQVVIGKR